MICIIIIFIKMKDTRPEQDKGWMRITSSLFAGGCTRRRIELSEKVFIRYDSIIHRRSCDNALTPLLRAASLLITKILYFFKSRTRRDADMYNTSLGDTNTRAHANNHSPPAGGHGLAISGLITSPLCRN